MKKTLYFLLAAAAALCVFSCAKEEPAASIQASPATAKVSMTVAAGMGKPVSRTYLDGYKVKWSENDQIGVIDSLVSGSASNAEKAKAIQTFALKSRSADHTQAVFEGLVNPGQEKYYATYPYDAMNFVNAETGVIRTYFASNQKATAPGSFDAKYNPSVALLKDGSFAFKNIGGLLKVTLEDDNVRSLTLTAKDGGTVGGVYYVKLDENGEIDAENTSLASARTSVILAPAAGETFAPGIYYFCISARTYTGGINIACSLSDGPSTTKEIATDVVVQRSRITDAGSIPTKVAQVDPVNFPVVFPLGKDAEENNYNAATNEWVTDWASDPACASATRLTEKWSGKHGVLYSKDQRQAYMSWNWTEDIKTVCTTTPVKYFIETANTASYKISTVGVKGIWTGDFFEFVLPVKDFAAETTLSLTMPVYTRQGPTFWEVKYLDGGEWKTTATPNLPAFTGSEVTRTATWAIPFGGAAASATINTNQTAEMTFSNAIASGEVKIRVICVDGSVQSSGDNAVTTDQPSPHKASNGNADAPFYFWNPADRDHQAITIDVVSI